MAEFNIEGFEEVEKLFTREYERAAEVVPKMLDAGAAVLIDAQKAEAEAMNIRDSGELIKSIGIYKKIITDMSSEYIIAPTGKDSKGVRNTEKGFIAEYGKHGVPGRPWMTAANEKSNDAVHSAMREVWEGTGDGG